VNNWGACPICGKQLGLHEAHYCRPRWSKPTTTGSTAGTLISADRVRLMEAVITAVRRALPFVLRLADLMSGGNASEETRRAWARVYAVRDALTALDSESRP
jgi:hypothetical protein